MKEEQKSLADLGEFWTPAPRAARPLIPASTPGALDPIVNRLTAVIAAKKSREQVAKEAAETGSKINKALGWVIVAGAAIVLLRMFV